jgi:hypothetical protein
MEQRIKENNWKEEVICNLVDNYFIQSKNPLLNCIKWIVGLPVTKEDMKNKLREKFNEKTN